MGRLHDPACVGANFCSQSAATALANGGAILQTSAAVSLQPGEVAVRIYGSALGAFPGQNRSASSKKPGRGAAFGRPGGACAAALPCGECPACRRGGASCPQRRNRPVRPLPARSGPSARFFAACAAVCRCKSSDGKSVAIRRAFGCTLTPYSGFVRWVCAGTVCVVLGQGLRADLTAFVADLLGLIVERLSPSDEERLDPAAARREISVRAAAQGLALAGAVLVETVGSLAACAAVQMAEPAGTVLLARAVAAARRKCGSARRRTAGRGRTVEPGCTCAHRRHAGAAYRRGSASRLAARAFVAVRPHADRFHQADTRSVTV